MQQFNIPHTIEGISFAALVYSLYWGFTHPYKIIAELAKLIGFEIDLDEAKDIWDKATAVGVPGALSFAFDGIQKAELAPIPSYIIENIWEKRNKQLTEQQQATLIQLQKDIAKVAQAEHLTPEQKEDKIATLKRSGDRILGKTASNEVVKVVKWEHLMASFTTAGIIRWFIKEWTTSEAVPG